MMSMHIDVVCDVDGGESWVGGWSQWGWFAGGSLNGSRYRVFERTSTYHAAQQHCLQLGGYLARIDTIREQVFIEDFLRQMVDSLVTLDGQSTSRLTYNVTHFINFTTYQSRTFYV